MEVKITTKDYIEFLKKVALKIADSKDYITELDAATGDGDHWANMNAGFSKLMDAVDELENMKFNDMFKKIAMIMMTGIGGSSGVLYGSGYLKAASVIGDVQFIDENTLLLILEAELKGISERGDCKPGFKTMVDTLYHAVEAYKRALQKSNVADAVKALKEGAIAGMNATRDMEAVKGRACYQANKGVGHLDPGAVTMCYQIEILADFILSKYR